MVGVNASFPVGYSMIRQLGQGASGTVYVAKQKSLGRTVALKKIVISSELDSVGREESLAEGRALALLRSPNVISVYDVAFTGDAIWLVTQYVEGRDLQHLLDAGAEVGHPVAMRWVLQICSALTTGASVGITHRDIKPANILIDAHGDALLADFGVAELARSVGGAPTGTIVGTPAYMAPEQIRGQESDARTDLYAMALIASQLFLGEHPFLPGAESMNDLLEAQLHSQPLVGADRSLPAPVRKVLERALQKDASQRQPTVAEFARQLSQAADQSWAGWRDVGHLPPQAPVQRNVKPLAVVLVLVVVGAILGLALGMFLSR